MATSAARPTPMLSGKVVLVTGGAKDTGRTVCEVFARQGASVVVTDGEENEPSTLLKKLPIRDGQWHGCIEVSKDTESDIVEYLQKGHLAGVDKAMPTPNVCVNCTGVISQSFLSVISDTGNDDDACGYLLGLNLKNAITLTKLMCDHWAERNMRGSIINITNVPYFLKGSENWSKYVASVAAVKGFTKSVVNEYGRHGIRCNTLCDKQYGRTKGTAEIAAFLASDYSNYVTATDISVNGKILYGGQTA